MLTLLVGQAGGTVNICNPTNLRPVLDVFFSIVIHLLLKTV